MPQVEAPNGIVFRRAETDEEKEAAKQFAIFFGSNPGCDAQSVQSLPELFDRVGDRTIFVCGYHQNLLVLVAGWIVHPSTYPEAHTMALTLAAAPGYETAQNITNILTRERAEIAWPGCCDNLAVSFMPEDTYDTLKPIFEYIADDVQKSEPNEHGMIMLTAYVNSQKAMV